MPTNSTNYAVGPSKTCLRPERKKSERDKGRVGFVVVEQETSANSSRSGSGFGVGVGVGRVRVRVGVGVLILVIIVALVIIVVIVVIVVRSKNSKKNVMEMGTHGVCISGASKWYS